MRAGGANSVGPVTRLLLVCCAALLVGTGACSGSDEGVDAPAGATTAPVAPGPAEPATSLPDGSLPAPEGVTAVVLTVIRPDGSTVEVCVWLADDPDERSQGLMDVGDPDLGGKAGMVFVYDTDVENAFWMRNTLLPLSIAFVDAEGAVVSTNDLEPCPAGAQGCPAYAPAGPYRMALEVPQGRLDDLGVEEDSRLALGGACTGP